MPDFEEKTLREAVETAKKIGTKLYLDLPNQARHVDMQIIERVLSGFDGEDFGLVANNLYAFYFKDRFEIVAGIGLNIINKFSKTFYLQLGASDAIYSIESNIADISSDCVVYTKGYPVLMTLTHCPFKMLYNTTCQECSYRQNVIYKAQDGRNFALRRRTIGSCYFELVDGYFIDNKKCHNCRTLYDLRTPFKVPKKITKGMIDKEI